MTTIPLDDAQKQDRGLIAGVAAYTAWGVLPLLFELVKDAGAATVVADRTIWSLMVVGILLVVTGRTAEIRAIMRDPNAVLNMAVPALILGSNWLLYVYAVESGQVLEASFGYFINPLANIAIGMLLLGERLTGWQWVSIGIAVVAIAIQAIGVGGVPYIALGLALTFAVYGYLRKTAKASSATGLFIETLVLSPVALAYLAFTFWQAGGLGVHADPKMLLLLVLLGPATAVPLLLFAFAVQRLKMTTIGMLQYISPSIAFLLAISVFGEELSAVRLVSFGLIWLSLIVYSVDSVVRRRRAVA